MWGGGLKLRWGFAVGREVIGVGLSGVLGWVGLIRFAVEVGGRRLRRWGGGSVCACLRYQRWMLALSWARAVSASVGVSWGSVMASTGICCLSGGMLGVGASVSGRFCVLLESWGSGARAMRTNLRGGLEVVAERC